LSAGNKELEDLPKIKVEEWSVEKKKMLPTELKESRRAFRSKGAPKFGSL